MNTFSKRSHILHYVTALNHISGIQKADILYADQNESKHSQEVKNMIAIKNLENLMEFIILNF